jgi:predicted AlkP superfamily pyrophosphatase or phosphodiesterase
MPDLTPQILPRLQAHRLPGLDLGEGTIYPNYDGLSILNLPDSVCRLLGAPGMGTGPLSAEILDRLESGAPARRVILILMDALPFSHLQRWRQEDGMGAWNDLAEKGLVTPLTSIVPSTTSAALTSLWTGRSAAAHGLVGYELWLKEYGLVANMIRLAPMSFKNEGSPRGSLTEAGFQAESYLGLTTLGTHLAAHGVSSYAFQHYSITRSGLSKMIFKDVEVKAFSSAADLWVNLRQLVENRPDERTYTWVYWSEVDNFSHFYGPDDERPAAEFAAFSAAFRKLFLTRLSPALLKETVIILTADHGQIATAKNPRYDLRHHPNLTRRLHIMPTGEHRLAYLFVRPGQVEAVREYVERTWPGQFAVLEPGYAVQCGLFGPGEPHPRLAERLGDLIVAARGSAYLWWDEKENKMLGRHGGLSLEEMLVPFVAGRL